MDILNIFLWIAASAMVGGISAAAFVGICVLIDAILLGQYTPEEAAYVSFIIYFFAVQPVNTLIWALRRREKWL